MHTPEMPSTPQNHRVSFPQPRPLTVVEPEKGRSNHLPLCHYCYNQNAIYFQPVKMEQNPFPSLDLPMTYYQLHSYTGIATSLKPRNNDLLSF